MTRRTYVYDRATDSMIPKAEAIRRRGPEMKMELGSPFVSPVDGTYVDNFNKWSEHNRRNGVIDVGDDSTVRNPPPTVRHFSSDAEIVADIKDAIHNAEGNHDWKF